MLFTISKPHTKHAKKIEDRISPDFISFLGLVQQNDYVSPIEGFYQLVGNISEINQNVFSPESNKQSYLVKSTDSNKSLPTPIDFSGNFYEPIITKIWLPDNQILEDVLDTISSNAYLRKVQLDSSNLTKKDERFQNFLDWQNRYNKEILEEQERREDYKRKVIGYHKGLDLLEKSRFSELEN